MGPDGEDALCAFLRTKLRAGRSQSSRLQDLGRHRRLPWQDRDQRRPDAHQGAAGLRGVVQVHRTVQHAQGRPARLLGQLPRPGTLLRAPEADLGKAPQGHDRFQLNRLELEQDAKAGPALKRMQEILSAPSPYGLIQEAEPSSPPSRR